MPAESRGVNELEVQAAETEAKENELFEPPSTTLEFLGTGPIELTSERNQSLEYFDLELQVIKNIFKFIYLERIGIACPKQWGLVENLRVFGRTLIRALSYVLNFGNKFMLISVSLPIHLNTNFTGYLALTIHLMLISLVYFSPKSLHFITWSTEIGLKVSKRFPEIPSR